MSPGTGERQVTMESPMEQYLGPMWKNIEADASRRCCGRQVCPVSHRERAWRHKTLW